MKHLASLPPQSTISVLGPTGSFSHKAGELIATGREDLQVTDFPTMREVRRSVRDGCAALLPRINYSSGVEPDNQAALFTEPLRIRGQAMLKVQMCIGGKGEPSWDSVTEVHSKDVAIRQCNEALNALCPDAQWHETSSTVAGVEHVATDSIGGKVAVGSRSAMEKHGVNVWLAGASNAEQNGSENVTDFMLVNRAREDEPMFDLDAKYHGMVLTPANRPRMIEDISKILGDYGMDQESISEMPYAPAMYRFLMLFKRIDEDSDIAGMLKELEQLPAANGRYPLIKSLGSWNDRVVDPSLQSPETLL